VAAEDTSEEGTPRDDVVVKLTHEKSKLPKLKKRKPRQLEISASRNNLYMKLNHQLYQKAAESTAKWGERSTRKGH
jgi:shikimate kinase